MVAALAFIELTVETIYKDWGGTNGLGAVTRFRF